MQLIITASKDCYITNKIIDNKYRSKNSNVGHAATLDLFKLFEESGVVESGNYITENVTENSSLLIKFDYSSIGKLTSSILDIKDSNFKAYLELEDVSHGLQKPFNFSAICNPLVRNFEEGFGIDVNSFNDLGSSNYITSSYYSATPIIWKSEGASAAGGNDATFAQGSITVIGVGGWNNTVGFTLNDGLSSVVFLANTAANTPSKIDTTNYRFGINGATSTADFADRIFAAIALAKTNADLKITATDPGDGAAISLKQDNAGLTGNTTITLANEATRLSAVKFKGGHSTSHIDIITSASYGTTKVDLGSSTYLSDPNQDLIFDVTNSVSSSLKGLIPDNGFKISFSGSYATDNKTRFVKRFASRHVSNKLIVPKLRVIFNDEISDDSDRIFLDKPANVVLKAKSGFSSANFFDNSASALVGDNCGVLKITSGSYTSSVNFSQLNKSSDSSRLKGVYNATFTIPSNNVFVKKAIIANPDGFNVDLNWQTSDGIITFLTKKVKVYNNSFENFDITNVSVAFKNRKSEYQENEDILISCSAVLSGKNYSASKFRQNPDYFPGSLKYKVSELISGKTIISPDLLNSTSMSFYDGVFSATIKSGNLASGYSYKLELISEIDGEKVYFDSSFIFKVI